VTGLRLNKLAMSAMVYMGAEKKVKLPEYKWPDGLAWPEAEGRSK